MRSDPADEKALATMDLTRLRDNARVVMERIDQAARRAGRDPQGVRLIAVTKRSPVDLLPPLHDLGLRDFGENYPQELWTKAADARLAGLPIRWHLIGHLQGNKVKRTVPLVSLIHGVDSFKLLRSLDELAADGRTVVPPVCLQVNTSGEPSKHGWSSEALLAESDALASCGRVRIVGLMTMAALEGSAEEARACFSALRTTRDQLANRLGTDLPELSMGMSGDFEVAIAEGATLVRVGTALFEGVERA